MGTPRLVLLGAQGAGKTTLAVFEASPLARALTTLLSLIVLLFVLAVLRPGRERPRPC
ncbi:hypothetical protein O1L55_19235 [Streptomyces albulus]|nr:hypothetical protein [Streptomyces noursei]